jgi:polyhydroxyalkanoate synthesis regulator phasin
MKKGLGALLVVAGMALGSLLTMALNPIGAASALVSSGSSNTHESLLQQALDTLVGKGTITQSQANAVQNQLHTEEQQHPGMHPFGPMDGPGFDHAFAMGRDSMQQLTTLLKIDPQTLFEDLRDGKSIADIAKAQGVSLSEVEKTLTDAANAQIDNAVKNGWMTSQQAADLKAKLPSQIESAVNAKFPAGGMGFGFGHPGGHWAGPGPSAPAPNGKAPTTTAPKAPTTTTH